MIFFLDMLFYIYYDKYWIDKVLYRYYYQHWNSFSEIIKDRSMNNKEIFQTQVDNSVLVSRWVPNYWLGPFFINILPFFLGYCNWEIRYQWMWVVHSSMTYIKFFIPYNNISSLLAVDSTMQKLIAHLTHLWLADGYSLSKQSVVFSLVYFLEWNYFRHLNLGIAVRKWLLHWCSR